MAILRTRVTVHQISILKDVSGATVQEDVSFVASQNQSATENKDFALDSPQLAFAITVTNPQSFGLFSKDNEFFVDISAVDTIITMPAVPAVPVS